MVTIEYRPLSVYRVNPVTRCTDSIPGHTEAILHVSFSPDGLVLGTGGGDMTVRFWDVNTCTPIKTCMGHRYSLERFLILETTSSAPPGLRTASSTRAAIRAGR